MAKDKGADVTKVDGFNQSMDLLLSKRVDGTFNDSLSYLDYRKQKPNAKIKAIKGHAEQNKSAFAFSRRLMKTIEKFNKGLEKIRDNGELAKLVRNGLVKMFLNLNNEQQHALDAAKQAFGPMLEDW